MNDERYKVRELARLAGVTVRTLHHYDRVGLLRPAARSEAGYRLYGRAELLRLREVLAHRALGMPLEEIRRVLDDPGRDPRAALRAQREALQAQAQRVAAQLRSVEACLRALEGESMNAAEIFEGFDPAEHEPEAQRRWGEGEAYRESQRRTARYTAEDWAELKAEAAAILDELAARRAAGDAADGDHSRALAERHRLHVDRWFYPCDRDHHARLAEMYLADERFAASFEAVAPGLTEYLVAAIRANLEA